MEAILSSEKSVTVSRLATTSPIHSSTFISAAISKISIVFSLPVIKSISLLKIRIVSGFSKAVSP
jgi:hypothetical protein